MLPFRHYLDAADPCAGGSVRADDRARLRWTADGFTRECDGETELLEPADSSVHLARSATIRHGLFRRREAHVLHLEIRGVVRLRLSARVDTPDALEGLPWREAPGDETPWETAADLLRAVGLAGVPVASWPTEATARPELDQERRLSLGVMLGRHRYAGRVLSIVAIVPALVICLSAFEWTSTSSRSDGARDLRSATIERIEPGPRHQVLHIRYDDDGSLVTVAWDPDRGRHAVGETVWLRRDKLRPSPDAYARTYTNDPIGAPVPAAALVLLLPLLVYTVRWPELGLLRRGRLAPGQSVGDRRHAVSYVAHDGETRTTRALCASSVGKRHVCYDPAEPRRAVVVEASFGNVGVSGDRVLLAPRGWRGIVWTFAAPVLVGIGLVRALVG